MKKMIIVMFVLLGFSNVCFANAKPYVLIQEEYTVMQGDTLDSITNSHIIKNTYGTREFLEFREGIKQLNPQLLNRPIETGETLHINYWVNNGGAEA